jgi:hypothetical protein
MAEMICPKCGRNYSDDLLYCLDDGTRLNVVQEESEVETVAHPRIVIDTSRPLPDQEFCPSCGMPNTVGSRFCKKCGRALTDKAVPPVEPLPAFPDTVAVVEPQRRSYAPWIALTFGLLCLLLLVVIVGIVVYNSRGGNVVANVNTTVNGSPTATPKPKTPSPSPTVDQSNINAQTTSRIGKTGILTTDTNLREEPDPNSDKVGTQFKGARIKVLEVAEVPNDQGGTSVWFHVQVTSYGKSIDPNNYGLEKDPDSKDEGWINSNPKVYDQSKKTQVHKRTVDFGDNN